MISIKLKQTERKGMIKFPSFRDTLNEANGQKAIDELEHRRAHREKEAALVDARKLGSSAINHSKLNSLEAAVQAGNKEFGTDIGEKKLGLAPHDEQFHIPDVEPTVSKAESVEGSTEEDKQIAA